MTAAEMGTEAGIMMMDHNAYLRALQAISPAERRRLLEGTWQIEPKTEEEAGVMTERMGIALDLLIAEGFGDEAEEIRRAYDALEDLYREWNLLRKERLALERARQEVAQMALEALQYSTRPIILEIPQDPSHPHELILPTDPPP